MLNVGIVGGSGYTGGELLRLLLFHPHCNIQWVTSRRWAGKSVAKAHPNLRGCTPLKFVDTDSLTNVDLLFLCLPHGKAAEQWDRYAPLAPRVIDLSADFRLNDEAAYRYHYHGHHPRPDLMQSFVYGIPELHREEIREAQHVACAGCNATVSILSLQPLYAAGLVHPDRTVIEVKVGSSEGGNVSSDASHHPERAGSLRSFKPTGHRHTAEIQQELGRTQPVNVHMSATSIDMVRGALATCHLFPTRPITEKDIWKVYRQAYNSEPFVRIVKERDGIYRYPEPKLLAGTNYCDVGFELDPRGERLVVIGAIDNLMKGSAGQAVQNMNVMYGFEETLGLTFPGLHPV